MVPVNLRGVSKSYGKGATMVLESIDLDIDAGELFFLLGPSGCGKSTLLRIIAGLLEPSGGEIRFGGEDVTRLPTERRQTAMVFQNYALWPHMSVLDNVMFGLTTRKIAAAEADKRARAALDMVGMGEYAARRPAALSGGQQQRVALARAMVVRPRVLLLDEPLSNLDAKLRVAMRREIRVICKEAGLTAIYVTHDQKEALAMADRMAVLHEGKLQQVGAPRQVYQRPVNRFVADFIGEANFSQAKVLRRDGDYYLAESPLGTLKGVASSSAGFAEGAAATMLIRPEALRVAPEGAANGFPATIVDGMFLGELGQWTLEAGGERIAVFEQEPPGRREGDRLWLSADPENVVFL